MINASTFRRIPKDQAWFTVRNAGAAEPVEILIYDQIGRDPLDDSGISAREFADALNAIPRSQEILLRIHSPGGNVWDGLAIHSMINARRDKIKAQIDGVAFSAASWVALGARNITIPANGRMMIHDAQGFALGADAKEMRSIADFLDAQSDNIASMYANKTGKSQKEMRRLMQKTTWLTGNEAKDIGLVDEVTQAAALNCAFDLSTFGAPAADGSSKTQRDEKPQPHPQMKREKIIALLNKLAIKFDEKASDADLLTLLENAEVGKSVAVIDPPKAPENAATDPKIINLENELKAIRAERDAEKKLRIEAKLDNAIAEGKIPAAQKASWVKRCMADESTLQDIDNMPARDPGSMALGGTIENNGNPLMEKYKTMKPGEERNQFRVANYGPLLKVRRGLSGPTNVNTFDSALVPDFLADAVITVLTNRLAPLRAYSRNFSTAPMPRQTVQVKKATTGSAVQTNPTNFETGDTTLDNIAVAVSQISKSFHITNDQLNSGFMLADLARQNANIFANGISDVVTALLLVANYSATTVIGTAANFDTTDLPTIWALGKDFTLRNLILDGAYIARLAPQNTFGFTLGQAGAFGFDGIFMNNRWTSAVANSVGFLADPQAMAVASGLPLTLPAGEFLSVNNETIADLGLTVQTASWFSRAGRVHWASYDVMFGAAPGDATAGFLLVSA